MGLLCKRVTIDGRGKCEGRKSLAERLPELIEADRNLYACLLAATMTMSWENTEALYQLKLPSKTMRSSMTQYIE